MPELERFGDNALLIRWEQKIDVTIHKEVLNTEKFISDFFTAEVIEIVPAYCSLVMYLRPSISVDGFVQKLKAALKDEFFHEKVDSPYLFHIPVVYGEKFGPDLQEVCQLHRLTVEEAIEKHTLPVYTVFFLGFLPGFPYLSGLPKQLHTPRKKSPQARVEKGSIGIGAGQTGIYTVDSPGGWNIIGPSPLQFFNPKKSVPSLFVPGDRIRFYPISEREYIKIETEVAKGSYIIKREIYHD